MPFVARDKGIIFGQKGCWPVILNVTRRAAYRVVFRRRLAAAVCARLRPTVERVDSNSTA